MAKTINFDFEEIICNLPYFHQLRCFQTLVKKDLPLTLLLKLVMMCHIWACYSTFSPPEVLPQKTDWFFKPPLITCVHFFKGLVHVCSSVLWVVSGLFRWILLVSWIFFLLLDYWAILDWIHLSIVLLIDKITKHSQSVIYWLTQ